MILALRLTLMLAGVRLAREPKISKGFNVNCKAKVRNQIHYSRAPSSHNIDRLSTELAQPSKQDHQDLPVEQIQLKLLYICCNAYEYITGWGVGCLHLCFRYLQYTIHRGILWTWKRRMLLNLDVPVHGKPHLTGSR